MNRRDRRKAGRQGGIPVEAFAMIELVSGGMFAATQQSLNHERLASSTRIWVTNEAAVAVCPGYDDFLIWLDVHNEGATAVLMTAEAVDDFSRNVLPAINHHRLTNDLVNQQLDSANVEWLLSTCNKVRDEGLSLRAELPDRPRWQDMPDYDNTLNAYHAVTTALSEFLTRHDTTPDPGTVLD